jgi:phage replication-related protein YjqB (UPF0714/DUF867 family)
MKLLFDHNLPLGLVAGLADLFPHSEHVFVLGLERATDREIREHAQREGFGSLAEAQKLARSSKQSLVNEYGVAAQRIVTNLGTSRRCRKIDFWLAPSGLRGPKDSNIELLSQSQLIGEAEKNRYTIRRLEFIGNDNTYAIR